MNVLMEGIPKGFEYSQVESTFMQIEGVMKVHNLRIWALSLDKTALSAHLAISKRIRALVSLAVSAFFFSLNKLFSFSFFPMKNQVRVLTIYCVLLLEIFTISTNFSK